MVGSGQCTVTRAVAGRSVDALGIEAHAGSTSEPAEVPVAATDQRAIASPYGPIVAVCRVSSARTGFSSACARNRSAGKPVTSLSRDVTIDEYERVGGLEEGASPSETHTRTLARWRTADDALVRAEEAA